MTPKFLQWAAPENGNWDTLSKVSQTYGALSVLFSAAALVGVVVSLLYQARQIEIANLAAERASHRELVMASIEDPELAVCWAPSPVILTLKERKENAFVNLILSDWWANYRLKRTNDAVVQLAAEQHFQGEAARRHWGRHAGTWRQYCEALGERRAIRFVNIFDDAYTRAVTSGPPVLSVSRFSTSD